VAQRQRLTLRQYLRQVLLEMRKVAWPTRAAVVHNSAVYLGVLVIVIVMVASVDAGLAALIRAVTGR
jgi:preprotein translocase subunit SecE